MATEHFCLRWNNHQSTLISVFDNLLESGTLVDCTLAADGRYLKAHKVVLSACSPYLGMLLSQHYDKHPIIILKDVKFEELKAMLDYMYRGEVNISQEQLSTFLKAAETLQIKGLTDTGGEEGSGVQPNRPPSSNSTTSLPNEEPQSPVPPGDSRSSPSPKKRKRNYKHSDESLDSESQVKNVPSDGSDRSVRDNISVSGVNPLSALKNVSFGSVKREPSDADGDGPMSIDESGDSTMLSRPGPSNGSGSNSKGSPWVLSADSTGEEMQLTPGQDGDRDIKESLGLEHKLTQKESQELHLDEAHVLEEQPESTRNSVSIYRNSSEGELIVPDLLENSKHSSTKSVGVIHLEQCHQNSNNSSVEAKISAITTMKLINKNTVSKSILLPNKTTEVIKDTSPSIQCLIVKGSTDDQLAARNFINVAKVANEIKSIAGNDECDLAKSVSKLNNVGASSTEDCLNHSRICASSSKGVRNVTSKFRKILPLSILPRQEQSGSSSQIPAFNQTIITSTVPQVSPQGITSVPYTFSFASPLPPTSSSSQQIKNNQGLQMQPQFTIPPSQIQDGQQSVRSSASHQGQYAYSSPQFQNNNMQTLTINKRKFVINQPSQSMTLSQPIRFVAATETSNQPSALIAQPNQIKIKKVQVAYIRTEKGSVSGSNRLQQVKALRGRPKKHLTSVPKIPSKILPKILPKCPIHKDNEHQILRSMRESTEFIVSNMIEFND